MKSLFYLLLLATAFSIYAQKTVFIPDTSFRAWLQEKYPEAMIGEGNAYLNVKNKFIKKEDYINIKGIGINTIDGIEFFPNLKVIVIEGTNINRLPALQGNKISSLYLGNNKLKELPPLKKFKKLMTLVCDSNQLESLPDLNRNKELDELKCNHNKLKTLPSLKGLKKLKDLNCSDNLLTELPDFSTNLELTYFSANHNNLKNLPPFSHLKKLNSINVNYNSISELPHLSTKSNLKGLRVSHNLFNEFPDIDSLPDLISINLSNNRLSSLPVIKDHKNLNHLIVSHNNISEIPDNFFAYSLLTFDISHNKLTEVSFLKSKGFGTLNVSGNPMKYFPDGPNVSTLIMDSMQLEKWPDLSIVPMKKFSCAYNNLKKLPKLPIGSLRFLIVHHNQLSEIQDLQYAGDLLTLDISYNKFKELSNLPKRHLQLQCQGNVWRKKPIVFTYELGNWEEYGNEKSVCDCCE